jgi:molybdate transport system substrate-binding protein
MTPSCKRRLIGVAIVCAAFSAATPVGAAEIKVIASNAVKEAYKELLPAFEKASGNKISVDWGATVEIANRIENGETADLIIVSAAGADMLVKDGKLDGGTRADVAKSSIGVAVRTGLPKPDISTSAALKKTLIASKAILISGGLSGDYMLSLFRQLGIAEDVQPKIKQLSPDHAPGDALAHGEGDITFTQTSELLPYRVTYVGPLPSDLQLVTVFSAAIPRNAPQPQGAKALMKFLTGENAIPILTKAGLDPG